MQRHGLIRISGDDRGTAALEFAIVGPVFLSLVIGIIYTCLLLFCMGSMQYAVEKGARCASINAALCPDSASIISYTAAAYSGPITSPTFTYATLSCGHSVSGSANFAFDIGLTTLTVPLSATACFP